MTNQHCSLPCHGPETPCEVCRRKCPGRATCSHPCPRVFCHPGVCNPCTQMVKKPCFCGKSSRQFRCCDVCEEEKRGWFSCGKVCGRPLTGCRHSCQEICHEGPCEQPCQAEVEVSCPCGKRRSKMKCCEVQRMEGYDMRSKLQTVLECDANCKGEAKVVEKPKNRFLLPVVCLIILVLAIVIQWFIR